MRVEGWKTFSRKALAIGLSRIFPNVPTRGIAKSVANVACTTITDPTSATNRRTFQSRGISRQVLAQVRRRLTQLLNYRVE